MGNLRTNFRLACQRLHVSPDSQSCSRVLYALFKEYERPDSGELQSEDDSGLERFQAKPSKAFLHQMNYKVKRKRASILA